MAGIVLFGASVVAAPAKAQAQQGIYMGEVRLFAGTYCPQTWLPADGRLLQISDYNSLFQEMGVNYGGNGTTTFALPNVSVPTQNDGPLAACVATQGLFPQR
jgi:microcystin-dependent protein